MNVDVYPASVVYRVAGITRDDLKQIARRDLLTFPTTQGPNENSTREFSRLGLYEVVILTELHRSGLPWPKAAEVFQAFAWPLVKQENGDHLPELTKASASVRRAILIEHRDTSDPAFLVYYFGKMGAMEIEIARGVADPQGTLPPTLLEVFEALSLPSALEKIMNVGEHSVGVLNVTSLLSRVDATLAAMETD